MSSVFSIPITQVEPWVIKVEAWLFYSRNSSILTLISNTNWQTGEFGDVLPLKSFIQFTNL